MCRRVKSPNLRNQNHLENKSLSDCREIFHGGRAPSERREPPWQSRELWPSVVLSANGLVDACRGAAPVLMTPKMTTAFVIFFRILLRRCRFQALRKLI